MSDLPIFALSLDFRGDRRKELDTELANFGLKAQYVLSSKSENKLFKPTALATQTEIAIWNSHVKALKKFLQSGNNWGLILEDDARTNLLSRFVLPSLKRISDFVENETPQFNIVQLGFIPNSQKTGIAETLSNLTKLVLGLNRFDFFAKIQFCKTVGYLEYRRIRKAWNGLLGIPVIPLFGLRLGTHAYMVNREAAKAMCELFEEKTVHNRLRTIDQELLIRTKLFKPEDPIQAMRFNLNFVDQLQVDSDNNDKTSY